MQAIKPGTTFTIMQALGINEAIRSIANTINKNSPYVEAKPLNLFFDTSWWPDLFGQEESIYK